MCQKRRCPCCRRNDVIIHLDEAQELLPPGAAPVRKAAHHRRAGHMRRLVAPAVVGVGQRAGAGLRQGPGFQQHSHTMGLCYIIQPRLVCASRVSHMRC